MPEAKQVDYIIVGQGLAGSAIAAQLMKRGKKILVIDQPKKNTSSKVAAGLFNPVTGKKMTKTWLADLLFPYLHSFYEQVEQKTQQKFFHPMFLYRPFLSTEEQNEWMAKSADPAFEGYIKNVFTEKSIPGVLDLKGGLLLQNSGYLDTVNYMEAVRVWTSEANTFLSENFIEEALRIEQEFVLYKEYQASKIIFCQGENTKDNKWFSWVPIHPLKGETLTIQTADLPQQIINRGVYIVPSTSEELKVGSTYNFHDLEPSITVKSREELEEKLRELVDFPYQVVHQEWGRRPTSPDRRPIVGAHPEHGNLIIFNGMGTKGVSLAPYFSEVLVRWLEGEIDLNKAIDVNRYKSLYSKLTK